MKYRSPNNYNHSDNDKAIEITFPILDVEEDKIEEIEEIEEIEDPSMVKLFQSKMGSLSLRV
jgi:hypothetical protein